MIIIGITSKKAGPTEPWGAPRPIGGVFWGVHSPRGLPRPDRSRPGYPLRGGPPGVLEKFQKIPKIIEKISCIKI